MGNRFTRRSQSVVPFGIGSIVEFEREALMPAGLDMWPRSEEIYDDRLAQRLGRHHFRLPPRRPEPGVTADYLAPLPYVRFPTWHFCPRCRFLKQVGLHEANVSCCQNTETSPRLGTRGGPCSSRRYAPRLVPVRFIAACPAGHVEDFPWNEWAHCGSGQELNRGKGCTPPALYFYATKRGGLSGLMVACATCGEKRSLFGATNRRGLKGLRCLGSRPWLGADATEACLAGTTDGPPTDMVGLQRGASNVYFPSVASSILIPPYSSKVRQLLANRRKLEALESMRQEGGIPFETFELAAKLHKVDPLQLKRAYEEREASVVDLRNVDETTFRLAEYAALQEERRDQADALTSRPQALSGYGDWTRQFLGGVTLIERLTETRALTGFSRVQPGAADPAALSLGRIPWLPAFQVRGEGIFLTLDPERLERFAERPDPRIERQLNKIRQLGRCALDVSAELLLLHTLSHLLINRLSFEAGYGASSIRERIYATSRSADRPMGGVLLYTAAGDADGTLGGLVSLGRPGALERVITGALEDARWCASDPICAESKGQGPESQNLAACHACALLPETSCELQNRYLDRLCVSTFFEMENA